MSFQQIPMYAFTSSARYVYARRNSVSGEQQPGQRGNRMKKTVHNDATSSNLKGKPMTKTIGLHWLQQVTKHVPATDEASVHRAQLRVKTPNSRTAPPVDE